MSGICGYDPINGEIISANFIERPGDREKESVNVAGLADY